MHIGDAAEVLQLYNEAAQYFPYVKFKKSILKELDERTGRFTTYVQRIISRLMRKLQRALWPTQMLWSLHNWTGYQEEPYLFYEQRLRVGVAIGEKHLRFYLHLVPFRLSPKNMHVRTPIRQSL